MKPILIAPLAASLLAFAALPALAEAPLATATFTTQESADAGTADLSEGPEGVVIRVTASGLKPGWHAIHFHETGDCSDEGYKKSGSHVQHLQVPEGSITAELIGPDEKKPHGLLNQEGPDSGDLPNIYAGADGTVNAELYSDRVTLSDAETRAMLLDEDGSALVIHKGPDDHMSQPIGGAGGRVACAVIEKVE